MFLDQIGRQSVPLFHDSRGCLISVSWCSQRKPRAPLSSVRVGRPTAGGMVRRGAACGRPVSSGC